MRTQLCPDYTIEKQIDKETSYPYSCLVKYQGGKEMIAFKEEPLGRRIYYTAQDIRNMVEKILQPYDLTVEQMLLLKNMSVDTGITQKALGGMVNKTPANLTRKLDRLEMKSLIVRQPEDNGRKYRANDLGTEKSRMTENRKGDKNL